MNFIFYRTCDVLHPFLSPVSHPSPFHFLYVFRGLRNFLVVKNLFFTPPVKCHMFNFAWHYVILPRMRWVRCIAGAIKNKTLKKIIHNKNFPKKYCQILEKKNHKPVWAVKSHFQLTNYMTCKDLASFCHNNKKSINSSKHRCRKWK